MLVFIDESGDHNLDLKNLDNEYNVFVLAAVCFHTKLDYKNFDSSLRELKKELFGSEAFIIHTSEITRPNKSRDQLNMKFNDKNFRKDFYQRMNSLIDETKFLIIPRVIDKLKFAQRYNDSELVPDPYNFSFDYVINRIIFEAKSKDGVEIYAEERNTPENIRLLTHFETMKGLGTKFISSREIKQKIKLFQLRNKSHNDSGLQLADLIVTPIGRHVIGKRPKEHNEISFSVVKEKLRNKSLEVFPK